MKSRLLVTGSSSGIGREIAIALSKDFDIIVHGRNIKAANSTRQLLDAGNHHIWISDFRNPAEVRASLAEFLESQKISVNLVVHSAGVSYTSAGRLIDAQVANEITNINYLSPMQIFSALLSRVVNGNELKSVVALSSVWSSHGAVGQALYSGSKAALDASIRCLALESKDKARFNSISLGVVDSPMAYGVLNDEGTRKAIESTYPLGVGSSDDVIPLVKYLLGTDSKWLTGQTIVLDGGRSVNFSHPKPEQ